MAIPFALMAAGTALQVAGNYQANLAQSKLELQNSIFYKDQAEFAYQAGIRETDIAQRRYTSLQGAQKSAYARGGVDISGSAASVVADTVAQMHSELKAIDLKTKMDFSLAIQRSRNAEQNAAQLSDFGYNAFQAGGTLLGNATKGIDNGRAPSFTGGPSTTGA